MMGLFELPPTDPRDFLWFLPWTLGIAIWVAWSDMKHMKIPNKAVLALAAVWVLVGFFAVPWQHWLVGFALMALVLAIGFVANLVGLVGAGDAKFAAAMAPFFAGADLRLVLGLFAACLLGAFAAHRGLRALPAFRAATPDWASWTHHKFPMGLALGGLLVFHPVVALILTRS
jgi:prepilin peptidase CpaA